MSLTDNRCLNRVLTGAALGCTVGGAVGACYGTYEAFSYGVSVAAAERSRGPRTLSSSSPTTTRRKKEKTTNPTRLNLSTSRRFQSNRRNPRGAFGDPTVVPRVVLEGRR